MTKLRDICRFQSGGTPSRGTPAYFNGNVPWITTVALNGDVIDGNQAIEWITDEAIAKSAAKIVPPHSVMVGTRVGIGKVAINSVPMSTSQDIISLIGIDENKWDKKFICHLITANKEHLTSQARGATIKGIKIEAIADLVLPEISLEEQARISEVIGKVDALMHMHQQMAMNLEQLIKSRFIELFGDPDGNPMNWETAELERHLEIVGGFAFKSEGFADSGIPVLRIGNINSGHFLPVNMVFWPEDPSLARYKMYPGDLVMSLTGTVGKDDYGNVCVLSDEYPEYYLNQRNAKLAIGATLNRHYLSEMLKFSRIKKRLTGISRGVRQANISNRDILALRVPIPPIKLQEQFAAFVEQTDKSKLAVQKGLQELEILKKSLMQQYFG